MVSLSDIGRRLIAARIERGWSQRRLAEALGIHQQQVARWELAEYGCVSLSRLTRVAESLGVEPEPPGTGGVQCAASETALPLAAEAPAVYGVALEGLGVTPVRDLGEVVARIRAHADDLHERFRVTRVDVFGSFARGEQRPDSDVDLILEIERPSVETVFGAEEFLARLLGRKADTGSFGSLRPRVQPYVDRERVNVWKT